jgi:hypothetical protein
MTGAAWAQPLDDEGPIILGQETQWEWFNLRRLGGYLELESRYSRDSRTSPGVPRVQDTELLFRETLGLNFESYIGRPEVFTLRGTGALSFRQSFLDRELEGGRGRELDWENLYDIQASLFDATRVPITAYSLRHQSLLNRPFAPTLESTTTEHGVMATFRSEVIPTTVRYFRREQEQVDPSGQTDFGLVQDTFQLASTLRISEAQRLQIDYTYDNIDESLGRGFALSFDRHDLALTHTVNFGRNDLSSLRSMGRYFQQSGTAEQERWRLDELLRLVHSSRFETRYNLTLERLERPSATQDFILGGAGLRYRLFESLVTTANAGASRLETDDAATTNQFADVGLRYTKKVPYGQLDSSVGLAFNRRDQDERGTTLAVFNEPHVFNDPQPIVIIRRNILRNSIVVTDAADVRVYVQNIDYTLQVLPDRVEIRRIVGGAILEGELVLVDYLIGPEPASVVDSTTGSATVRYSIGEGRLKGLALYGAFRRTDQRLVEGLPQLGLINNITVLLYGAEYRTGPFTLTAEREHHDSDVLPFDALRLNARYDEQIGRRSHLSLGAGHERIDYRDPRNRVQLNRLFGIWVQELGGGFDMELQGLYRYETDELFGDLQGFEQTAELRWARRQTEFRTGIRNTIIDGDRGDSMFQMLYLNVRRSF